MNETQVPRFPTVSTKIRALREAAMAQQGGRCAVCHSDLNSVSCVLDHNHRTKVIRSAVCHPCNIRIGVAERAVKGTPAWMEPYATYLHHHAQNPGSPYVAQEPFRGYEERENVTLRMPASLMDRIRDLADERGLSNNNTMVELLEFAVANWVSNWSK